MTILYLLLIVVGVYTVLVAVYSLRVSKRKRSMPAKRTYGPGINKHMLLTGIEIEHGMVITDCNELQAQSKLSDSCLESMLLK